jgi:hypothetical protein
MITVQYAAIVKLNCSNALNKQFNLTCIYLNTQVVPHFKHTSHASKLLLKMSKVMEITGHEIGSVGLQRCILPLPYSHYQSADWGSRDIHQSAERLAERGSRDLT